MIKSTGYQSEENATVEYNTASYVRGTGTKTAGTFYKVHS
jgi:hypothetical protein